MQRQGQTDVASIGSAPLMAMTPPQDHDDLAAPRRRVPMALITWAFVVLVLLIVVVLIVLKVTRGATAVPPPAVARAPASVVAAVTSLPPALFDTVEAPAGAGPMPQVLSGQPALVAGGLPEVVFVGAEFSPFSASARWAVVAALSRFGSFSALGSTSSSPDEVFPRTVTFTFDGASYRSRYVTFTTVEAYGDSLSATAPAGFPMLHEPSAAVAALLHRYDGGGSSGAGAMLPFLDVGNRVLFAGAGVGVPPGLLRHKSMSQVAAAIGDATTPLSQAVIGAADEISAALCAATGGQPAAVCQSPGVRAGAVRLGLG